MASLAASRQKKAFAPDPQTTRFLYLILKQLDAKGDLKTVSWQEIADNIGIKNGHAARMRWSRFKQHAEGAPPQPKTTKPKKTDAEKNGKRDQLTNADPRADNDRDEKRIRFEHGGFVSSGLPPYGFHQMPSPYPMPMPMPMPIKLEPSVKMEQVIDFSYRSGSASSPPPTPFQWQPSSQPRPPPNSCPGLTPDEDLDDIPIKQLNSSHHATISLSDLQLNSPIKPGFDASITSVPPHDTIAQSAAPGPAGVDQEAISACADTPDPPSDNSVQPGISLAKTTDEAHRPSTPSSSFTPPPVLTWPTQHTPAFQPGHQLYHPPYPPYYRPHPYQHPYRSPYGHPPPHQMGYQQRCAIHSSNTTGPQVSQAPVFPQHAFPLQSKTVLNTSPAMQCMSPRTGSMALNTTTPGATAVESPKSADQVIQQSESPDKSVSDVATEAAQVEPTPQLDAADKDAKTPSPSTETSKVSDGEIDTPPLSNNGDSPAPQPVPTAPSIAQVPRTLESAAHAVEPLMPATVLPASPGSTPAVVSGSTSTEMTKDLAPTPASAPAPASSTPELQTQTDAQPSSPSPPQLLPHTQTRTHPQPQPVSKPQAPRQSLQQPQNHPQPLPPPQPPYAPPQFWWLFHPTAPFAHNHSLVPSHQHIQQTGHLVPPMMPTGMTAANTIPRTNTEDEDDPFAFDLDFSSIQDDLNLALDGDMSMTIPMEPQFVTPKPTAVGMEWKDERSEKGKTQSKDENGNGKKSEEGKEG